MRRPRTAVGVGVAATLLAVLLGTACGAGRPAAKRPAPSAPHRVVARSAPTLPAAIHWQTGERINAEANVDWQEHTQEQLQGAGGPAAAETMQVALTEQLTVGAVADGVAMLRVQVTSWHWRQNLSEVTPKNPPGPATIQVDRAGRIVAGEDWLLPGAAPLPGIAIFAAPLSAASVPSATGSGVPWGRTDTQGLPVAYGVTAAAPGGGADGATGNQLSWQVARRGFTPDGDAMTIEGSATALVRSRYDARRSYPLLATSEQATYQRTTTTPAGAVSARGMLHVETTFHAA